MFLNPEEEEVSMCGICGIWGSSNHGLLETMMNGLSHRGPDGSGIYASNRGALGHRRLSIMDPEHGNQPIYNEDNSKAIIANGEIYNFPQVYEELSKRHALSTKSDSEAILHLYEEHGVDVVNYLDGMFAFCIADGDSIFLARDYIGIKPLYYTIDENGTFYFSSELRNMTSLKSVIQEFPPGTWYHSDIGFKSFYEVPDVSPQETSYDDHVKGLRKALEDSVVKRLMSDVPLGAFLSGGLDSSLIAAIARKNMNSLHTFSVGIEGSRDIESAHIVSKHIDSIHHEYIMTAEEVIEELPEIIFYLESFDQDLVRSAIPCYFTSRLASNFVKAVLTGEGADELFGGYRYYKGIADEGILHSELRRSVNSLHNINLQRVDRMTMAHSIEGRVPFLDTGMIELGQIIPTKWKVFGNPPVEKWILRKSFEGFLPEEIIWREKQQFDEGSGTVDLLSKTMRTIMKPEQAETYRQEHTSVPLRSSEECYYHQIFSKVFPNAAYISKTVGRWSERPELVS